MATVFEKEEAEISRRDAWQPPARPEWVERINAEGRGLDIKGIVPLDSASLIATARQNTGLDDFGSDDWREPLEILLKSFNEESDLSLVGRIMTRSDLLMMLEGRLRVEDVYRRHPEIDEQQIEKPLWILGQGRTGTSILQTLMALDPDNRTLQTADAMFPVHEGGARNPFFDLSDHRIRMWNRVTPEVESIHDFGAHEPIETIMIESMSFQCPAWLNLLGLAPSYTAYAEARGHAPALQYAKRVLKVIQWQNPGRRWVLKSPDALRYMPTLVETFPDVRLIWAHRDPIKALSSAINMIGTLSWIRSDRRLPPGIFDAITDPQATAASLSCPIDWIGQGLIPEAQLYNMQYRDLMSDPIATLADCYRFFGLELTDAARAAITGYLEANPRSSRPPHRYSTGEQERIDRERTFFKRYQDYFDVPNEA